jgi:hypothetical protein
MGPDLHSRPHFERTIYRLKLRNRRITRLPRLQNDPVTTLDTERTSPYEKHVPDAKRLVLIVIGESLSLVLGRGILSSPAWPRH